MKANGNNNSSVAFVFWLHGVVCLIPFGTKSAILPGTVRGVMIVFFRFFGVAALNHRCSCGMSGCRENPDDDEEEEEPA